MTGFEITRDIVLLTLGAVGTILSLYNFWELRGRGLRHVRVTFGTAIPTYDNGQLGESFVSITAANTGHRDVTITNLGIELPKKKTLALLSSDNFPGIADTPVPIKLSDGEIACRYYPYESVNYAFNDYGIFSRKWIKPFAVDSSGRRHYGTKICWK